LLVLEEKEEEDEEEEELVSHIIRGDKELNLHQVQSVNLI
jgi:hypothetical protein